MERVDYMVGSADLRALRMMVIVVPIASLTGPISLLSPSYAGCVLREKVSSNEHAQSERARRTMALSPVRAHRQD